MVLDVSDAELGRGDPGRALHGPGLDAALPHCGRSGGRGRQLPLPRGHGGARIRHALRGRCRGLHEPDPDWRAPARDGARGLVQIIEEAPAVRAAVAVASPRRRLPEHPRPRGALRVSTLWPAAHRPARPPGATRRLEPGRGSHRGLLGPAYRSAFAWGAASLVAWYLAAFALRHLFVRRMPRLPLPHHDGPYPRRQRRRATPYDADPLRAVSRATCPTRALRLACHRRHRGAPACCFSQAAPSDAHSLLNSIRGGAAQR